MAFHNVCNSKGGGIGFQEIVLRGGWQPDIDPRFSSFAGAVQTRLKDGVIANQLRRGVSVLVEVSLNVSFQLLRSTAPGVARV